jgi:hypothetical protein
MYLDLRSPSAMRLLFKALGLFVVMTDPMIDRADQLYARIVGYAMKDADVSDKIDLQTRKLCLRHIEVLGLESNDHDDTFIQKTLEFDGSSARMNLDQRKIPKNNLVAALRLVKRCSNRIAIQHSLFDFSYGLPRYFYMKSKWAAETEFLSTRFDRRHNGMKAPFQ